MSRKCPECLESGRAHLPGCSYAPVTADREEFIRQHAVDLVRKLEEKVRRQAKVIFDQQKRIESLVRLRTLEAVALNDSLARNQELKMENRQLSAERVSVFDTTGQD